MGGEVFFFQTTVVVNHRSTGTGPVVADTILTIGTTNSMVIWTGSHRINL
jgi:methenyltetrahydromethanopterin cyclohydrolase